MALPAVAKTDVGRAGTITLERGDPPVATSRLKRFVDVVGAAVLLVVSAPLFAAIAVAIRVDSRGPVLLRQERCGQGGRRFLCLKFRSMHADADEGPHRRYVLSLIKDDADTSTDGVYKLANDERVTRLGHWLRRSSLDELPQLWNVLRGDMSLVGPRPPLPYEVEHYDARQHERLTCRPGLTGLWQVSGRNQLSYRQMCEIDVRYVREWNHGLDARILLRTLPVVLLNSGRAR